MNADFISLVSVHAHLLRADYQGLALAPPEDRARAVERTIPVAWH